MSKIKQLSPSTERAAAAYLDGSKVPVEVWAHVEFENGTEAVRAMIRDPDGTDMLVFASDTPYFDAVIHAGRGWNID